MLQGQQNQTTLMTRAEQSEAGGNKIVSTLLAKTIAGALKIINCQQRAQTLRVAHTRARVKREICFDVGSGHLPIWCTFAIDFFKVGGYSLSTSLTRAALPAPAPTLPLTSEVYSA
jgi:hypothetical protein